MTREEACARREEAIAHFVLQGVPTACEPYGSGHINDTFRLTCRLDAGERHYILQRINHEIFRKPKEVMENIAGVTAYLREEIIRAGGDPERETLNIVPTREGQPFYLDSIGSYWRAYCFIEDAVSLDAVTKPEDFYRSAVAFGNFQRQLAGYPAATLHETIPNFHNTPVRFETLERAVREDALGRAALAKDEITFAMARKGDAALLTSQLAAGELPLRVTHNDTKLNNVMLDSKTGNGICVIDLDTVMPGLTAYDFGDSIRFGASTGAEDERDLSKISMDLGLFELYAKGFLEGSGGALTKRELESLRTGSKLMTLECGVRFLTDYLQGDTYFKIHREGHNLDRCRTQFKLVADMEQKWDEMGRILAKFM